MTDRVAPFGVYVVYWNVGTITRALRCGAKALFVRLGQDGWDDPGATVERLEAAHAAGLELWGWWYVDPGQQAGTCVDAKRWWATKLLRGFVVDPEAQFIGATRAQGEQYLDAMHDAVPDAPIGCCPVDNIGIFPQLWEPYAGIISRCDFVDPQIYPTEHNDEGFRTWHDRVVHGEPGRPGWEEFERRYPEAKKPRRCVVTSYRPKVRGGKPTPPRPDYDLVGDVALALAIYPDASIFTVEAMDPRVEAYLVDRATPLVREVGPTFPETAVTPLRAGPGEYTPPGLPRDDQTTDPDTPDAIGREEAARRERGES